MIIKLEVENIGPYSDKIVLDFRTNKRDKSNSETVYTLPDGEKITKIAGIIAGNAYGKTTILRALNSIGSFIDNPILNKELNSYVDEIEEEETKNYLKSYGKLLLLPVNKSTTEPASITVEMYINSGNEYSGYYTYTLKYDNDYLKNGVQQEILKYRKKYNSKIVKEILKIENNIASEIGHKIAYKNNYLNDLVGKSRDNLIDKINYYETFYNRYVNESSTLGAENYVFNEGYIISQIYENKELIKKFINLADSDIKDIEIDKTDPENEKLFFIYDNFKLRYSLISTATKKLCGIATNFYKANKKGGVFLIDELDNSFNKNIADFIIKMYNTDIIDSTSQLIFTTNNADILSNLRRDQIFIIEKNQNKNSIIKYLNFIDTDNNRKSRKDWSFAKAYDNNIIKNFPQEKNICQLTNYIKENL